jgi:type II secretory pathway component GspD/PulD (secretin)
MIPIVRPLLEPGASVAGADHRLFVRTSAKNFGEIQRAVAALDTPRRMLRIEVAHDGASSATTRHQELSGEVAVGDRTRIIVTPRAGSGGGVERDGVRYRVEQRSHTSTSRGGQFLTVLDGGSASLRVGTVYSDIETFLVLAGNRLRVAAGTVYREVGTGFDVRPRLANGHVLLDITPRLAFRGEGGTEDVHFQELTTTVRAPLGAWVDLGGSVEQHSQVHRAILSRRTETGGRGGSLRVKVDAAP